MAPLDRERTVRCAMLVTWEDHAGRRGPLIQVPVTMYGSRARRPAPEPVLWMPGGPGASAMPRVPASIALLDTHELWVLEQRGTRTAQPALECPSVTALRGRLARGLVDDARRDSAWTDAIGACASALRATGANVAHYHTRAMADDVEALRVATGRTRFNLYGESYSTQIMLTVLALRPTTVRSAVLDSPMPLDARFDEVATTNLLRALRAVVDGCLTHAPCADAHPRLHDDLHRLFRRYARAPVWVALSGGGSVRDSMRIGPEQLAAVLAAATRNPQSARVLPVLIERAAAGNLAALTPLFQEQVTPSPYTLGQRLTLWCSDVVPIEDRGRITAQRDSALGAGGGNFSVLPPAMCDLLGVPAQPPLAKAAAPGSDVPVLLLHGDLDPWVPPSWGRTLLGVMPRAQLVELAGRSHTPGFSPCAAGMIVAFIKQPAAPVDTRCAVRDAGIPAWR